MSKLIWTIAGLMVVAVDIAGPQWYLDRRLGNGKLPIKRVIIGGITLFALFSLFYFLSVPNFILLPLLLAGISAYSLITYNGSRGQRIAQAIIAVLLVAISQAAVVGLLLLLPGVTIGMLTLPTIDRMQAMIASRMLFMFLIFLFSNKKSPTVGKGTYWMMVISLPAISLLMLAALVQYDSRVNAENSNVLIAVSFGIFAMNVLLLTLHDRLRKNTGLLVEKETMLRKAEIENRYFNEALAAGDNLRGFRHDLKNHLQVLNSLLEMNNVKKARDYLNEIGNFIGNSDIMINCGNPLIDAVLGSKVAMAKKYGIDILHTVSLTHEIGMEPLDLCSILGNVLDNAIEACRRIDGNEKEKRIEISLHDADGPLQLLISNTMDPAESGKWNAQIDQKSGNGHGIGLSNVNKIVHKYSGTIQISQVRENFKLQIAIPA